MDHTELGRAGELAMDLYAMVSSDGELQLFTPVADDDHVDATVVADIDRAHHPELDDRAAQLRVDDGSQGVGDGVCRWVGHWPRIVAVAHGGPS